MRRTGLIVVASLLWTSCTVGVVRRDELTPVATTLVSPLEPTSPGIAQGEELTPAAVAAPTSPLEPTSLPPGVQSTSTPRPTPPTAPKLNSFAGLVYRDSDGLIWQINADGRPVFLVEGGQYARLSPDGTQLLYTTVRYDGDIWLADLSTREHLQLTDTPDNEEGFDWWSAHPGVIVFNIRPDDWDMAPWGVGYLATINVDGSDYRVLDNENASTSPPALSPDGQTIALSVDFLPWLYHWDHGSEPIDLTAYTINAEKFGAPAWSPEGNQLAYVVIGGLGFESATQVAVVIFDLQVQTARLLHPYTILVGGGWSPQVTWSPDGQWLTTVTQAELWDEKSSLWVLRADGTEEHHLERSRGDRGVWSPDGRWLVYSAWNSSHEQTTMVVEVGVWQPQQIDLPPDSTVEDWGVVSP